MGKWECSCVIQDDENSIVECWESKLCVPEADGGYAPCNEDYTEWYQYIPAGADPNTVAENLGSYLNTGYPAHCVSDGTTYPIYDTDCDPNQYVNVYSADYFPPGPYTAILEFCAQTIYLSTYMTESTYDDGYSVYASRRDPYMDQDTGYPKDYPCDVWVGVNGNLNKYEWMPGNSDYAGSYREQPYYANGDNTKILLTSYNVWGFYDAYSGDLLGHCSDFATRPESITGQFTFADDGVPYD